MEATSIRLSSYKQAIPHQSTSRRTIIL